MTHKEKIAYIISTIAGLIVVFLGITQVECIRTVEAVIIFAGSFGAGGALVAGLTKWKTSVTNQKE